MGAGYTRWFRPGGDIGIFLLWNNVPSERVPCIRKPRHYRPEYEIRVKPVWPSNKTSVLPNDLYPAHTIEFVSVNPSFKHTVHKFDKDIYFFQPDVTPDVTYIDEAANFTEEQIKEFWNTIGKKIKGEKVPTNKRQRFLDAGGRFEKQSTDNSELYICKNYICNTKPRYFIPLASAFHYHPIGTINEAWFVKDRTHNFENILQNTNKNIWHAARDRKFYIRDNSRYAGPKTYVPMADKHLISTMRYLVAAWEEIKKIVLKDTGPHQYSFVYRLNQRIYSTKNAPSFYEIILPCWPTLVSEFVERFGSEALTSVLDGN